MECVKSSSQTRKIQIGHKGSRTDAMISGGRNNVPKLLLKIISPIQTTYLKKKRTFALIFYAVLKSERERKINSIKNSCTVNRVCTETRNLFREISVSFGKFREISDYFGKNLNFCTLKFSKFCKI